MDVTGDGSKVQCCKEQYDLGTWTVMSMNQGKLEAFKQDMAIVNINIFWVSKLNGLEWVNLNQMNLVSTFPGKNTGVGYHFLLQEIFPTKELNPDLLHCRQTLYHLSHQGRYYFFFSRKILLRRGGKNIQKNYRKKDLHEPDNHDGVITHLE